MSTSRVNPAQRSDAERSSQSVLQWRTWPLVDSPGWSWIVPTGLLAGGGAVLWLAGSWLVAAAAMGACAATLWQLLLPVNYEVNSLGVHRHALGRTRLVPWHAIRAYQPRATGIVFFQRPDPTPVDALRSFFLPYAADEDETLCAVRQHLSHAVELPLAEGMSGGA